MHCEEFPSFGLWAKPGTNYPFLCLEPWVGRCDNIEASGKLEEKYGIQILEKGQTSKYSYTITVH